MNIKIFLSGAILVMAAQPLVSMADTQCGPFHLENGGSATDWVSVDGQKVRKQKTTFLQQQGDYENSKTEWIVAATKFTGDYRMRYTKEQGKASLHVEIVRTSASQIRISGEYGCK